MKWWPCSVLIGCARAAASPASVAPSPPRPTLACPDGRPARELVTTTDVIEVRGGDCALYPCGPAPTVTTYQVCGASFAAGAGSFGLACHGADGAIDGPFVVDDGTSVTRGTCAASVLDGAWQKTTGSRVDEAGRYRAGKQEGTWRGVGQDGGTWIATYHDGQLDGRSEGFDAHGRRVSRATYVAGRPDGVETTWDADQIASTETYDHDRLVAFDRHRQGTRSRCTTSDGDEHCTYTDAHGVLRLEGTRAHGDDRGQWRAWYPTGELLGTTTSTGTIIGHWAESDGEQQLFYRDGTRLADTFCAAGGGRRGRWTIWYPGGTVHFDDDQDHPTDPHSWRAYAPDGTPSTAAQSCGGSVMSCEIRGSSDACRALEMFAISVVAYDER